MSFRPAGRSKYGAKPVVIDGIRWASSKQARRYEALRELQKHGFVRNLQWEKTFPLLVNGIKVCSYRADFIYEERQQGESIWHSVVEDVKGYKTDVYRIKAKLMKAIHGITIKET